MPYNTDISYNHPPVSGIKHNKMKTLKLEVGKTYRSRVGEEVKIVKKNNATEYPYRGNNLLSYTESGRFHLAKESDDDLIEEVPETRHTFDVPDGVKKITVSRVGNCIVVEMSREEVEPKPKTTKAKNECLAHTSEDVRKMINLREMNKVLTRIKKVYLLKDIDVRSRLGRQVEARAIWTYYLIEVEGMQHADAAKIVGRKRPMMYHYVKLVKDLYETNIPFRERFNKIGIPWRS